MRVRFPFLRSIPSPSIRAGRKYFLWPLGAVFAILVMTPFPSFSQGLFEEALSGNALTSPASPLHGFIRTPFYTSLNEDDELYLQSVYGHAGLSVDLQLGQAGSAYAEAWIRSGIEFGEKLQEFTLREGWVSMQTGPVRFSIGKQIFTRGNTSFINPTMQYTPEDPVRRSPKSDDRYLGTWATDIRLDIASNSSLSFTWLPVHTSSRLITSPFSFPAYVEIDESIPAESRFRKSSIALLYDLRAPFLDLQLSFFHGNRSNPGIAADSVAIDPVLMTPDLVTLVTRPYRVNTAGICLTVPLGSYILRAEGNWLDPQTTEAQEAVPFPELSYAMEIEQTGNAITAIAGYYGKYIMDHTAPGASPLALTSSAPDLSVIFPPGVIPDMTMIDAYFDEQVAGFNRLYNYQRDEFYHAAYGIISLSMLQDRLSVEFPLMYNFTTEEITFSPSLEISITDGLKFQSGGMFLRGPDQSLMGLVGPELNAFYISLEAMF